MSVTNYRCSHLSHGPIPLLHLDSSCIQHHQTYMSDLQCQSVPLFRSVERDLVSKTAIFDGLLTPLEPLHVPFNDLPTCYLGVDPRGRDERIFQLNGPNGMVYDLSVLVHH